jgi:hypothetical protein
MKIVGPTTFLDSPQIAALYTANWLAHKAHSVP